MPEFPFEDRWDAGEKLGRALEKYRGQGVVVLAIPRGGAVVGYQVARRLGAEFSLIVSRKLPFPDNPESGFGAITEDGSTYLHPEARFWVGEPALEEIIRQQKQETARRVAVLRKGKPLPALEGRTVILVDDGIAMGSTMRAAIQTCRNQRAAKIVVAAPVAGIETARAIGEAVDELVVLETPPRFRAVAQVYRRWHDLTDAEVLDVLARWERETPA